VHSIPGPPAPWGPEAVSVTIAAAMGLRDGLRAVLYDWDGTLVDSAATSYRCYVRVFSAFGIEYDQAAFERTYTPDWYRTYEAVGLPRPQWPEADTFWTRCYEEETSVLLPGARAALERVECHGLAQGLVSSGDGSRVRREIRAHGLARFFGSAVVCGGETVRRKPDPEPLALALERLSVPAAGSAYLGDSPEDVAMAKAAGVLAVGIPGGFPNRQALAAAEPDLLAPSLAAALDALIG
jgi:beta-phosphoglucomutase-like phosphatase (HAD superfamily)